MKKIMIPIVALALFAACNGGGNETKDAATTAPKEEAKPADDGLEDKALGLIGKSGCITCHKIDEKLAGPAYTDVAKKYDNTPENVEMLVNKVIKGGAGNWGDIQMIPHPDLPKADIETMVKYILSLRK